MDDAVVVERRDRTLLITLNRPAARNAVDRSMSATIAAAVDRLDGDDRLTIGVLTGAGGNFCSGMDLKAFLRGERPEVDGRGFAGLTEVTPKKPLIAAVEGWALAGGFELVLACDLVVAATDARFGLPEVTRGLIAGSGGLIRLPSRIPRQIAVQFALTGEPMLAVDAHRWGLVNELTEPGGALDGALSLAARIGANAPTAIRVTKEIIDGAPDWPVDERWGRQRALLEMIVASSDAKEGAHAFAERRPPRWTVGEDPLT